MFFLPWLQTIQRELGIFSIHEDHFHGTCGGRLSVGLITRQHRFLFNTQQILSKHNFDLHFIGTFSTRHGECSLAYSFLQTSENYLT